MPEPIDYAAMAKQAGATSSTSAPASPPVAQSGAPSASPKAIDYAALAKQAGATSSTSAPAPDILERALNYRTGNDLIDAPMGVMQGAAKGAIQTVHNGGALLAKIPLLKSADDAYAKATGATIPTEQQWQQGTTARGVGQGTGKFLEQAAEFAVPAARVSGALRSAGLTARVLGQAGVGAGVSAIQSGGDPTATAVGGALGGAGELAGAATSGAKALLAAKSPTLANFSVSFGNATPTQKARIFTALSTLKDDGIVPPNSVQEMSDLVKGRLKDLGSQYDALDPAIKNREVDPNAVVLKLRKLQQQYTRRDVPTNDAAYKTIQDQIDKVQQIALKNGGTPAPAPSKLVGPNGLPVSSNVQPNPGKINIDDIVHMKQNANGQTNWNSSDVDKSLWNGIGDVYRSAADTLAPETTPINRAYQKYKDLDQIADENIARGKGSTDSGLTALSKRMQQHGAGAGAGAALGGAVLGPVGAAVGGVAGGIIGPRLGSVASQALRNAVDSGAFRALPALKQSAIKAASAAGDNAAVLRLLGQGATQETAVSSR